MDSCPRLRTVCSGITINTSFIGVLLTVQDLVSSNGEERRRACLSFLENLVDVCGSRKVGHSHSHSHNPAIPFRHVDSGVRVATKPRILE